MPSDISTSIKSHDQGTMGFIPVERVLMLPDV